MSNETKLGLTMQDFLHDPHAANKLHFDSFGKVEKALSVDEFNVKFRNDQHLVLTPERMAKFIAGAADAINKAEGEDDKREIAKAVSDELEGVGIVTVYDGNENTTCFVKAIEVEEEQAEVEKGHIAEALDYGIKANFKKTGKEIKARLAVLKSNMDGKIAMVKAQMTELLQKCDAVPQMDFDEWDYRGLKDMCSEQPKRFGWDEVRWNENNAGGASPEGNAYASSKEQAANRQKYNNLARELIGCCVDKLKIEAYERNLEDGKSYEIANREATVLGF